MFRRSVVLTGRLNPERGAFPHALELSHRLQVPVHGVEVSGWADFANDAPERMACARACSRVSVPWEWSRIDDPLTLLRRAVVPDDLVVFDQALAPDRKSKRFRERLVEQASAVLVCPSTWNPLARVLVVDHGPGPADSFVVRAARLCNQLGVEPIVLTVRRSEWTARRRHDEARELLARHNLTASFDCLIGIEVRAAVACVARWRHCQLVVLPREDSPSWWRWLWRAGDNWFMNGAEFASFLSLPDEP
jgi:hypothetical protein